MAFDLDGTIKDFGFSDEEAAQFRALFGKPERVGALEKGYLRQSDYSKQSDALKKAQDQLKVENDRLNTEIAEWAAAKGKDDEAVTKLRGDIEKSQNRIAALTARITRLATEAGQDPTKALEGLDDGVPPRQNDPPPVPPVDTSKFVGADQFGAMSEYMFNLATELPALAVEHQALTGTALDTRKLRAEIQKRARTKGANLDPRAIWEEIEEIPQKRAAQADEQRKKEIAEAENRGFQRARSEAALPVPPSNGVHSPVLRGVNGEARTPILKRTAPETGVRSAADALATGKYRQPSNTGA